MADLDLVGAAAAEVVMISVAVKVMRVWETGIAHPRRCS